MTPIDGETLARACVAAATEKKATDSVLLDLRGISTVADFFVICSAESEPQLKAIATSIRDHCRQDLDHKPLSEEGAPGSQWIVIDYGEVIVHLFQGEKRSLYGLEDLWSDARRIDIAEAA